jgi:predicted nucleic acid-binding protein
LSRVFFDTAIFLYAVGADHPYRDPCRRLVSLATDGHLHGEASVELLQEFVHVRWRRRGYRQQAVREAADIAVVLSALHDLTEADLRRALGLFEKTESLTMRDAIHAATALNRGVELIVSPDSHFDEVAGLTRIDPAHAEDFLIAE